MKRRKMTTLALRLGLLTGILASAWIVPPAVHKAMHLCPVRPDGVAQAQAVPAFARKYNYSCMQCHSNFPTLNEFGRQFKTNGYVVERNSEEGVLKNKDASYWTEKLFPFSVVIRSRPYDKTTGTGAATRQKEFAFQPMNDMDFFVAGGDAAKHVSFFGELDANSANGFAPTVGDIQAGYHFNEYFNVIGARRGFFVMDPYQTLAQFGSTMIGNRATAGLSTDQQIVQGAQPGNNADANGNQNQVQSTTLDQTTQTGYVYGEAGNDKVGYLYYAGGLTAGRGLDNGTGSKAVNGRLAYDTMKGVVIGTFYAFGHQASNLATLIDRSEFRRTGADLLVEKGPVVGRAAILFAQDRDLASNDQRRPGPGGPNYPLGGTKTSDRAAYVDLSYIYKRGDSKIPFLIPEIRYNWYTTYNKTRSFDNINAQLTHYFLSNFKGFIEWDGDTKQDVNGFTALAPRTNYGPRVSKASRWIVQLEFGF